MKSSDSRRRFLGHMTTGLAGALASAPASVLGANERVRVGIIGPGDRGMQIVREAMGCPNVDMVAFADVYTARLEAAKQVAPGAKTFLDYRYLLDDKSVDAVLIATPQHLHCEHFVASLDAGKHVYQEKTMAFTVEHAKRMRSAYNKVKGKRAVQIGHQHVSSGYMEDTQRLLATGKMGRITALPMYMYRNTPHGKPQWSRPVYPDMTQENIIWNAFLGEAPKRDFDANRYVNWRFFWDYSGGNVYENFCHQLSIWYKALNLEIPKSATMLGGVYLWKDGREVPDTMNVTLEQPEDILITWHSGFGNNQLGWGEDALGTDGTLARGQQVRYIPQKVNQPQGTELVGQTRSVPRAHMQNFFDSIRENKEPNCPFEIGFRISIACRMAVDSYRTGRTLRWDREKEEIVG